MANQPAAQNFQNHAKYVPLFHFVAVPILIANFCGPPIARLLCARRGRRSWPRWWRRRW